MTLIVYKDGVMAADTAYFRDEFICRTDGRKIIRTKTGHLVGACGLGAYCDRFLAWGQDGFPLHTMPPALEKSEEDEFVGLVVRPDGRVLEYGPDMLTTECTGDKFVAIGVGAEFAYALGTLDWSAVDIVKHAIKHFAGIAGDVYSLSLSGRAQLTDAETAEPKEVAEPEVDLEVNEEETDGPAEFSGYSPMDKKRLTDSPEDAAFLAERGLG